MTTALNPILEFRFNTVRELYTEFFMLLDQSINEEPGQSRNGSLDRTIEMLMKTIEEETQDLRREVDASRGDQTGGGALDQAILLFDDQLRKGLTLMNECVQRRIAQLTQARESLKERLQMVKAKQRGARGYRGASTPSRLVESQI